MSRLLLLGCGKAGASVPPGPTDPHFASVVFLWEGDGTHGAAGPFTDVTGKTITLIGGALSNVQAPPGATCSYRVGAAGGATVPDHADFRLAAASTDPYTIEFSTYQTDL